MISRELSMERTHMSMHSSWFVRMFALGFLIGILIVNTIANEYAMNTGMFSDYFIMKYQTLNIDHKILFGYIFEKRMVLLTFLFIAGFTGIGKVFANLFTLVFGFGIGTVLSVAAGQQGLKGILICLAGCFPHYLIYIPLIILTLQKVCSTSDQLYHGSTCGRLSLAGKKVILPYCLFFLIITAGFIIGIMLESYINPLLLKKLVTWI